MRSVVSVKLLLAIVSCTGFSALVQAQQMRLSGQEMATGGVSLSAAPSRPGTPGATSSANVDRTHTAAAPADYVVGSGDVLSIVVWHEKELSTSVMVRPDGKVTVPLVGEVQVAGLSPTQVEALVRERMGNILVNPQVWVSVSEVRSRTVYITGEVARPGAYPLNSRLDVLQLIAQAGGLTEFAKRKKIRIVHAGESYASSEPINYSKLFVASTRGAQYLLAPGDTVVIP